jgi:hypothetical protein
VALLVKPLVTNESAWFVCAVPFTSHVYEGEEPPAVIAVLNTTAVPEQTLLFLAVTAIVGVTAVLTVMVTGVPVAVGEDAQPTDEVIIAFTTSPFASVVEV